MANNIVFKGYKASEIEFVNKHENGTRIEFENKYSYNVKYSPNNTCIGEFTVEVNDKANKDKFHIRAVVLGIFTYNPLRCVYAQRKRNETQIVRFQGTGCACGKLWCCHCTNARNS